MSVNQRYSELNAAYREGQRLRAARKVAGWDAYRAFMRGEEVEDQRDSEWQQGWKIAACGGPRNPSRGPDDLCPGVLQALVHVGPDPQHIAGDLEWACKCCGWRISPGYSPDPEAYKRRPEHVPVHSGPWRGVERCTPIGGPGAAEYFDGTAPSPAEGGR